MLKAPLHDLVARLDLAAAEWFSTRPDITPERLPPLPIFGYPGWFENNDREAFFTDERYFRPLRADLPRRRA